MDKRVLPPLMTVDGTSQAQYAKAWWQWQKSVPGPASPQNDLTGLRCDYGQKGDVWFLASAPNGKAVERYCNVPAGRYLFVPVLGQLAAPSYENQYDCNTMKKAVVINWPNISKMSVELDGQAVSNMAAYRQRSRRCFDLLGAVSRERLPPKIFPSAFEGFWLMIKPLEPGEHDLKILAKYSSGQQDLSQNIRYTINVY
ncbi:hypothetical protein [Gallaecimonas sp. GXIMD1310]|uniref:hypothetical protein n=1 Tax=Gallaecimonas sp. GXIMD1310 TaxID=3131926 RepID=UPI003248BEC4